MMIKIAVLGGGISGLSVAHFLKKMLKNKVELYLFESQEHLGGWIQTLTSPGVFDLGPRGCRPQGKGYYLWKLACSLGIEKKMIEANTQAKIRYLKKSNQLVPLPYDWKSLWKSPLTYMGLKGIICDLLTSKRKVEDESIESFITRRFSSQLYTEFFSSVVRGIYAQEGSELSVQACFPFLDQLENQYRSIIKGLLFHKNEASLPKVPFKAPLVSFEGGMGTLIQALQKELIEEVVYQKVERIALGKTYAKVSTLTFSFDFDYVISTLPAFSLVTCLEDVSIKRCLEKVSYHSLIVVSIGFSSVQSLPSGFGYLTSPKESKKVLGMVWDNQVFVENSCSTMPVRLTLMLAYDRYQSEQENVEEAKKICQQELHDLGIAQDPDFMHVKLAKNAIPTFFVGYRNWKEGCIQQITQKQYPLILSGSYISGVAVNDCIAHSYQVSSQLAQSVSSPLIFAT